MPIEPGGTRDLDPVDRGARNVISLLAISSFVASLIVLSSTAVQGLPEERRPLSTARRAAAESQRIASDSSRGSPEGALVSVLEDDHDSGAIEVDTDKSGGSLHCWHCLFSALSAVVLNTGVFQSESLAQSRQRFLLLCRIRC